MNVARPRLTQANVLHLQSYDWPGNVRELQNVIERAVIVSRGGPLRLDLPVEEERWPTLPPLEPPGVTEIGPKRVIPEIEMRQRERSNIEAALEESGGRVYGPAEPPNSSESVPPPSLRASRRWVSARAESPTASSLREHLPEPRNRSRSGLRTLHFVFIRPSQTVLILRLSRDGCDLCR